MALQAVLMGGLGLASCEKYGKSQLRTGSGSSGGEPRGVGFLKPETLNLGHFQVGSYRCRSLIEGLYTLKNPYRSPIYPKLPTCSFF